MELFISQSSVSLLFIAIFFIDSLAHGLNLKTSREPLPVELRDLQTDVQQKKASDYLRDRLTLIFLKDSFFLILFLVLLFSGFFSFLQRQAMELFSGPYFQAFYFAGVLALGQAILGLPFSAYSTFKIESKYGFNRTDVKTFVSDLVKGALLTVILGGLIFSFILKMLGTFGSHAWFAMWIGYSVFQFLIVWIAPVTLLPLFLKLSPLPEGPLKDSIKAYSRKQDFKLDGAWVCDASKRSSKSNAFFTGFGKFRRLVLFDTLIAKHTPEEIVAIVAHEAGHFKLGHIWKMSIASAISSLIFFFVIQKMIETQTLYEAFQISNANLGMGLVLATIVFSKLLFFVSPIRSYISRRNEFSADHFSLTTNGNAQALVSGLKRLVADNLATLQHHPLYVFLYDSHPPLPDRIKPLIKPLTQALNKSK